MALWEAEADEVEAHAAEAVFAVCGATGSVAATAEEAQLVAAVKLSSSAKVRHLSVVGYGKHESLDDLLRVGNGSVRLVIVLDDFDGLVAVCTGGVAHQVLSLHLLAAYLALRQAELTSLLVRLDLRELDNFLAV